jgi:hypothetical protein
MDNSTQRLVARFQDFEVNLETAEVWKAGRCVADLQRFGAHPSIHDCAASHQQLSCWLPDSKTCLRPSGDHCNLAL